MGAWDSGIFDNDTAADWAADVVEGGSVHLVLDAIAAADVPVDEYLDAPTGEEALAAADTVAAASGRPPTSTSYNEDVIEWAIGQEELDTPEVRALAARVVERVLAAESEIADLWDEGGDDEWRQVVAELLDRLKD
jgi:hypothetical protein